MASRLFIQSSQTRYFIYLKELGKNIDFNSKCDKFILLGDLNAEPTNEAVNNFCQAYDCSNIVKKMLVSKIRKILPALI